MVRTIAPDEILMAVVFEVKGRCCLVRAARKWWCGSVAPHRRFFVGAKPEVDGVLIEFCNVASRLRVRRIF
jgi:hypothetical protein